MTTQSEGIIRFDPALSMARQSLYRFASLAFADPRLGVWDELNLLVGQPLLPEAASLVRSLPEAETHLLGIGERPLKLLVPERVLDRLPDSSAQLNSEYESTFGLLVSSNNPPYESEYVNSKQDFQRSNGLADIAGFYRAFGLATVDAHPERPDHLSLELEFMAHVIGMERRAWESAGGQASERQQVCADAQSRFLGEHLLWWAPAFSRLLIREHPRGFYAAAATFLAAWVPVERSLFGVPPMQVPPSLSTMERPEECEGCQIA